MNEIKTINGYALADTTARTAAQDAAVAGENATEAVE